MRVLRIVIGVPLALFALGYMGIGAMFMTGGPPFDSPAGRVLALTGLLGLGAPVVLFGLHLAVSGPAAPRPLRSALAGALAVTTAIALAGGLYALFQPSLQSHAAEMLFSVAISTAIFGAAIFRARFLADDS